MHRYRSIFMAYVHLGSPDCQADYLLDFLRTTSCEKLYLVGDIIDLIAMQRRFFLPENHRAVIRQMLLMAEQGVKITYLPGNHDDFLRTFAGQTFAGVEILKRAVHQTADGRRFQVCHGDQFEAVMCCSPLMAIVGDGAAWT